jgi:hypothetical protein
VVCPLFPVVCPLFPLFPHDSSLHRICWTVWPARLSPRRLPRSNAPSCGLGSRTIVRTRTNPLSRWLKSRPKLAPSSSALLRSLQASCGCRVANAGQTPVSKSRRNRGLSPVSFDFHTLCQFEIRRSRWMLPDAYAVLKARRIDCATARRRFSRVQSRAVPAREAADRR